MNKLYFLKAKKVKTINRVVFTMSRLAFLKIKDNYKQIKRKDNASTSDEDILVRLNKSSIRLVARGLGIYSLSNKYLNKFRNFKVLEENNFSKSLTEAREELKEIKNRYNNYLEERKQNLEFKTRYLTSSFTDDTVKETDSSISLGEQLGFPKESF